MTLQSTIETVPTMVHVEERAAECRADVSFHVRNDGADELELVAIEQDVYGADRGLLQRRRVGESTLIGPGEHRTIRRPMPEPTPGISLRRLVYTFFFRTCSGELPPLAVRISRLGPSAPASSFA